MALLEVEDLRVSFSTPSGRVEAVRGATFAVEAGATCALVGESGCGKSVTARSVMGLVRAPGRVEQGSRVTFDGRDVLAFTPREWDAFRGAECAMVFQDALASLNPTMRVGRQLTEALDNHARGMSARERHARAVEMLAAVQVSDPEGCMRRYPHELSGGMRQRVMIASAMVARPRLLIADEPTTSLDVTVQAQTLALMDDMRRTFGCAVLLITHDLGIVADVADSVVVMYAGEVVERGSVEDIFYRPAHPYTRALLASVPRVDAPRGTGMRSIEGTLPDLARPPRGCPFAPRCPLAMNVCEQVPPAVTRVGAGHEVACWTSDGRYLAHVAAQGASGACGHACEREGM